MIQPLRNSAYYHIYTRGNNRADLFREERNYRYFLSLYHRHIAPVAETYAYCLLRNHFHLLIRTRDSTPKTPSQAFSNLFNAYAVRSTTSTGAPTPCFSGHSGVSK